MKSQNGSAGETRFEYLGNTFEPLRDFAGAELDYINISRRTKGFERIVYVYGYSHTAFFAKSREANGFCDLYVMNGSTVVAPGMDGFYVYDLSIPLEAER